MDKLNENIITLYSKWKEGYTRKENSFELKVKDFLSNREDAGKFKISEDGKHLNAYQDVVIHDEDILDGKFIVPFGEIKGDFDCVGCTSLTSLEGAPKEVKGSFCCYHCTSLTSLEGAPKKVGWSFNCNCCTSLTSLVGAPEEIHRSFECTNCDSLTSLEGAPKKIGRCFDCNNCKNLTSLVGLPEKVGGFFDCSACENLTSIEDLPKEIGGDLYIDKRFEGKIPKDVTIVGEIKYYE